MSSRGLAARLAFVGLSLIAAWVSRTTAQDVVTAGPGAWGAPVAPPAVPPQGTVANGNVTNLASGTFTYDNFGEVLLSGKGTATATNPAAPGDNFLIQLSREQTFTLGEAAHVAIPSYVNGSISFSAANPNPVGTYQLTVTIYDNLGNAVGNLVDGGAQVAPAGGLAVNDKFLYTDVPLAAGPYKVRAFLTLSGNALRMPTPAGDSVTVDFYTGAAGGLATSFGAYPAGLGSSRAAINAPAARTAFGVDGTGIEVGLVEPGQPYGNHSALAGAGKLAVNTGTVAGDFRREHALAAAGIIAGADADNANAGIAPAATIRSAPMSSFTTGFQGAVNSLLATNPGMEVMNMSASNGDAAAVTFINTTVNNNPNLTFVMSAGNDGTAGSIANPGRAENIITVGALNRTFARRASFSSYGGAADTPMKPDIVAPGEYINAPQTRDVNNDGQINDFGRIFLGDDFRYTIARSAGGSANTGDISGTSFSAPHVSGTVALLDQYQSLHAANHKADHRVIKAVLLNSASTAVTRADGTPWRQTNTGTVPGLVVTRSLDPELGAGAVDAFAALRQYQPAEIRGADNAPTANFNIDASVNSGNLWDLQDVQANGRVNYLLGNLTGRHLRSTLAWDKDVAGGTGLMPLELGLYEEGNDVGNPPGFDPNDILIASTNLAGENVKLLDITVPDQNGSNAYYVEVMNGGANPATFGIAISVPEPSLGVAVLIGLILITAGRTGRARTRMVRAGAVRCRPCAAAPATS